MKHNRVFDHDHQTLFSYQTEAKFFQNPITEHDILDVQDLLMQPGYHSLITNDAAYGLSCIDTIVRALGCYYNTALLTTGPQATHPHHFNDLLTHFTLTHDHTMPHDELSDYLLHHFNFDFLLIELTDDLKTSPWFTAFCVGLADYAIGLNIPIITLEYT